MEINKTNITASIVIYHTDKQQLNILLKSIEKAQVVKHLYIIDNAPQKENEDYFNKCNLASIIEYIPHDNTGYGSSHNIALRKSIEYGADYHVILNPDISFEENVLESICEYMSENLDVVYVLPKVVYPNGELQYLCKLLPTPGDLIFRRFFNKSSIVQKKNDRYVLKSSGYNKIMNPPCLSGCFMFLRMSTIKDNNLFFDDRFFMYFEDFDLIRRLHKVGKTVFYPKVSIVHNHAKESYKSKKMLKIHVRSAIKYFNKWGWFFDRERKIWNNQILKEIETFK